MGLSRIDFVGAFVDDDGFPLEDTQMNLSLRYAFPLCCCLGLSLVGCKGSGEPVDHGPPPLAGPSYGPVDTYDSYGAPPPMDYEDAPLRPVPSKSRGPMPPPAPPAPEPKNGGGAERLQLPAPSAQRGRDRRFLPAEGDRGLLPVAAERDGRAEVRAAVVANRRVDGIRPSTYNPVALEGIEFVEIVEERTSAVASPLVVPAERNAYPTADEAPPLPLLVPEPRG